MSINLSNSNFNEQIVQFPDLADELNEYNRISIVEGERKVEESSSTILGKPFSFNKAYLPTEKKDSYLETEEQQRKRLLSIQEDIKESIKRAIAKTEKIVEENLSNTSGKPLYCTMMGIKLIVQKDPIKYLIEELAIECFSYLNGTELSRCCSVNKEWNNFLLKNEPYFPMMDLLSKKISFGKENWLKYFGDIGDEPPLPKDIFKILGSPCPFFPNKSVGETHMLILIPEKVNQKSLNLEYLGELAKNPKVKNCKESLNRSSLLSFISSPFSRPFSRFVEERFIDWSKTDFWSKTYEKNCWVLLTKDYLTSQDLGSSIYLQNAGEVESKTFCGRSDYNVPTILELCICTITNYVNTRSPLYDQNNCSIEVKKRDLLCKDKISVQGLNNQDSLSYNTFGFFQTKFLDNDVSLSCQGINIGFENCWEDYGFVALRKL